MVLIKTVSVVLGFLYPSFASFKALKTPTKDDDEQWLTYWVVYGLFHFFEYFFEWIVSWIPFYWVLKSLFIIWLWLPYTQGALILYKSHVSGFLSKKEKKIDEGINNLIEFGKEKFHEAIGSKSVQDMVSSAVNNPSVQEFARNTAQNALSNRSSTSKDNDD